MLRALKPVHALALTAPTKTPVPHGSCAQARNDQQPRFFGITAVFVSSVLFN
jgi:hypothetical protein